MSIFDRKNVLGEVAPFSASTVRTLSTSTSALPTDAQREIAKQKALVAAQEYASNLPQNNMTAPRQINWPVALVYAGMAAFVAYGIWKIPSKKKSRA